MTVEDLASLPRVDGYECELDHGRLRIQAVGPVQHWHSDMRQPDDEWDAVVKMDRLEPTGQATGEGR